VWHEYLISLAYGKQVLYQTIAFFVQLAKLINKSKASQGRLMGHFIKVS
jgi:hypothetical protein